MKAITQDRYGSDEVLQLREVDKPVPKGDEVLVRVHAASANALDWHYMRGEPIVMRASIGLRKPKPPVRGADVAGMVEAIGEEVTRFKVGDEVFGYCQGAFAEYAIAAANLLAVKPSNLTLEQAATLGVSGVTALQGLRDVGAVKPGQKVLIVGASGGVGTFAVQIAKSLGAEVTGVCSTRNVEHVRSLGADHVIDYTQEDFTLGAQCYDLVFHIAGTQSSSDLRKVLAPRGTLVSSSGRGGGRLLGPLPRLLKALFLSPFVSQRLVMLSLHENQDDLMALTQLVESGKVTPVMDKRFELRDAAQAVRYLEAGHTQGKSVVVV